MSRRAYNRLIAAILGVGAAAFVLLLAGIGSELITRPPAP